MNSELLVTIVGAGQGSGDDLRSLRNWLSDAEEFRGRVKLRPTPPPPGTLGWFSEAVAVTAPIATALVPVLISWIRSRHTEVSLKVTGSDGVEVELVAQRLRRLGADELGPAVESLVRAIRAEPPATVDRAVGERAVGDRAVGDRAVGERAVGDRAVGERPAVERPAVGSAGESTGDRAG